MKFLAGAALLTLAATSFAADRDIFDIMYLPNAGTTFGISEATMVQGKQDRRSASDTKLNGYVFEQTVGHSLTDRLLLSATVNYTDVEFKTSGEKNDLRGFSDGTLNARFRAMEEGAGRLDVLAGLTVATEDKEVKRRTTNNTAGGHVGTLGVQYGQKLEKNQWAVAAIYTHNFEARSKDSGEKIKYKPHDELTFNANYLHRIAEKSNVRVDAGVNFVQQYKDKESPAETYPSQTVYTYGAEYQHILSPDMLLRLRVENDRTITNTAYVKNYNIMNYTVGLNYQF